MKGFVYFIDARGTDYVKIGYSANPAQRMAAHQTSCPADLEILATVPSDRLGEGKIHRALSGAPRRGEWFRKTEFVRFATMAARDGKSIAEIVTQVERTRRKLKESQWRRRMVGGKVNGLIFQLHSPWWGPETRQPAIVKLTKWGHQRHIDPVLINWANERRERDERRLRRVA